MTHLEGGAAYIRNDDPAARPTDEAAVLQSLQDVSDTTPPEATVRIWELLETPQTVETICRVLRNEFDLPPAACTEGVKVVLTQLYRDDLIQLSPDT